ncbi:MAG: class I SAM-dependent methyltransferase [Anaerolineales bacterium]|nr:class I SAM-dependent methyltransferase [Anaerolineales bacterium]
MEASKDARPICDYEGSAYRTEFWGQGRDYEDAAERIALRALLPARGRRLIEIGAGYGRLAPLYAGYDDVIFFDYALSQLQQGRQMWGDAGPGGHPRYTYVAGDFYHLPFVAGLFDAVTMVRALHHAVDAPAVLRGMAELLAPDGTLVMEFANKRNLKAILRYALGRQSWRPFDREPVEFVPLNLDFHPAWIRDRLAEVGLPVQKMRTVSHFRVGLLKRCVPTWLLAALDGLLQPTGACLQVAPSVFVQSVASHAKPLAPSGSFFRCAVCSSTDLAQDTDVLRCTACGAQYGTIDGIYDFKEPLERGA